MRPNTKPALNAVLANADARSDAIPASQKLAISLQSISTSTINGILKVQYSNEESNPSNWIDITGSSLTINSAGTQGTQMIEICAAWISVLFTDSSSGMSSGTVTALLQSYGV